MSPRLLLESRDFINVSQDFDSSQAPTPKSHEEQTTADLSHVEVIEDSMKGTLAARAVGSVGSALVPAERFDELYDLSPGDTATSHRVRIDGSEGTKAVRRAIQADDNAALPGGFERKGRLKRARVSGQPSSNVQHTDHTGSVRTGGGKEPTPQSRLLKPLKWSNTPYDIGERSSDSQNDAIAINDDLDRAPPSTSLPWVGPTIGALKESTALSTRLAMGPQLSNPTRSSPPNNGTVGQELLIHDRFARKANIVSFNKQGPRNQGKHASLNTVHAVKHKGDTYGTLAHVTTTNLAKLNTDDAKCLSSTGRSVGTRNTALSSMVTSNIANENEDALAGFAPWASPKLADAVSRDGLNMEMSHYSFHDIGPGKGIDIPATGGFQSTTQPELDELPSGRTTETHHKTANTSQLAIPPPWSRKANVASKFDPSISSQIKTFAPMRRGPLQCISDNINQKRKSMGNSNQASFKRLRASTSTKENCQSASSNTARVKQELRAGLSSLRVDAQGSPIPRGVAVSVDSTDCCTLVQQATTSPWSRIDDQVMRTRISMPQSGSEVPTLQIRSTAQAEHSENVTFVPFAPDEGPRATMGHAPFHVLDEHVAPASVLQQSINPFVRSIEERKGLNDQQGSSLQSRLQQAAKSKHQKEHEVDDTHGSDPGSTMVEPEPIRVLSVRDSRKDKPGKAAAVTSSSETSPEGIHGILEWRMELQPHQRYLFDELLAVAHQLVRHLVNKEEVIQDIVDDYRRKGENVVHQMELAHAKEYQRYCEEQRRSRERRQQQQ